MSNQLFPNLTQDWNSSLIKKYEYGIWNFSYCVADMITSKDRKYSYHPKTEFPRAFNYNLDKFMKKEINRRERLKTNIINTFYNSLCDIGWVEEGGPTERDINFIIDVYDEVGPLLKKLDKEIKSLKEIKPFWKKEGRPIELRHQIASIWAQVMKDNRGSNWQWIERLLNWFFNKLKGTTYCKILGTEEQDDFDQFKFRNEYQIIKRNEQNRKNIEILREKFFPIFKKLPFFRMEFKKNYIDFTIINKKGPLIIFPDGETFQ